VRALFTLSLLEGQTEKSFRGPALEEKYVPGLEMGGGRRLLLQGRTVGTEETGWSLAERKPDITVGLKTGGKIPKNGEDQSKKVINPELWTVIIPA